MYLTKVAPISRIPRPSRQFLSYFTAKKLERGALVLVPLRKKEVKAIVFSQTKASYRKMEIKKAEYQLKPISKIIEKKPVLQEQQIELAKWISDYYWASFGKVLSVFLRNSKNKEIKNIKSDQSNLKVKLKIAPLGYIPKKEIKKCLKEEKKVLILTPEREKIKFWKEKLKELKSEKIIIGTRSSLFLPFENLGLLILTEEGNPNYKSEMEPRYNAKEVAKKLTEIWGAKLIIVSSFPSVETYNLYARSLITRAKNKQTPLKYQIIDMRQVKPWKPLSEKLLFSIKENTKKGGKTLLFLNRRGTATTLLCQDCGWIQKCDNCNVPLTYHLKRQDGKMVPKMICHYCEREYYPPKLCKKCKSWNLNTLGVGTEKIEEDLVKSFGRENVLRLDSEITKKEKEQKEIIKKFIEKKNALLLTTSIIFKYFPIEKIPLVGIVSIDSLLSQPDFKLEEECARIIDKLMFLSKKDFILQTFFPNSKAVSWTKNNKETFYEKALQERKKFNYPPFSSLIKLSITHKNLFKIKKEAFELKQKVEDKAAKLNIGNLEIMGPAPAFIEKLKGKYQWKLILKLKIENLKLRNNLLSIVPPNWKVDVGPGKII